MTVRELIDILEKCDPNLKVLLRHTEYSYPDYCVDEYFNEIDMVSETKFKENPKNHMLEIGYMEDYVEIS